MHTVIKSAFVSTLALSAFAFPVVADEKEPHSDVWLRIVDGTIVTGSITEGTPGDPIAENERVFATDMGEEPDFPFSAFEPGWQSLPGRDTAGLIFSFSIPGPLLAWDGTGLVTSDHSMVIDFGPESVVAGAGPVSGFEWSTQPSGLMHLHFDFTLAGPLGDPTQGVYVLPIQFAGATPVYAPSETAWIVFNLGEDEEVHDAAIEYTERFLACSVDISGDGTVDASDLGVLLGAWGSSESTSDLNEDGLVDASDLAELLGAWGWNCPN